MDLITLKFKENKDLESGNSSCRRLFLGGLMQNTKEEDVVRYFQSFGKVQKVELIFDKQTNTSRRFGFVTMESETSIDKILSIQPHYLLDKQIDCKLAIPKAHKSSEDEYSQYHWKRDEEKDEEDINIYKRKIFVGNLGKKLVERDLVNSFIRFGGISKCFIKRSNNISRGFGFVIFQNEKSVDTVFQYLSSDKIVIKGNNIKCKKAFPRTDLSNSNSKQEEKNEIKCEISKEKKDQSGLFNEKLLFLNMNRNEFEEENFTGQLNLSEAIPNFDFFLFEDNDTQYSSSCSDCSLNFDL